MRKWMALLFLGLIGAASYIKLTQRDQEDGGWDYLDRDWWDM